MPNCTEIIGTSKDEFNHEGLRCHRLMKRIVWGFQAIIPRPVRPGSCLHTMPLARLS